MTETARSDEGATDEELLARLGEADEPALRALHRRYAAWIFTIASRRVDPAAAEEVVQDVFVTLWRKSSLFDPSRGTVRAWLGRLARNAALNARRGQGRRGDDAARGSAHSDAHPDATEEIPDADDVAPDEALWLAHRRAALRAAVAALPPGQREALSLAYFDDLTQEQVAAALSMPLGTAKTRIRLAMRRLAPLLAAFAVVAVALILWRRAARREALESRALEVVTSSDVAPLRLAAVPGIPVEAHGTYRARPGHEVAVLTASHLPPLSGGDRHVGWVRRGSAWIALGTLTPREDGGAIVVAESAVLGAPVDEILVTREIPAEPGSRRDVVLRWVGSGSEAR